MMLVHIIISFEHFLLSSSEFNLLLLFTQQSQVSDLQDLLH